MSTRMALAHAIDREYPDTTWPVGGWSQIVQRTPERRRGGEGSVAPPHLEEVRDAVAGKRALLVSNRGAPEITALLHRRLGLECDAVAAVGSPRRREHLLERIRRGTYDLVLVAQGFAGHGDTATIKAACNAAGVQNVLVGKGRLGQIVANLHRYLGRAGRESN